MDSNDKKFILGGRYIANVDEDTTLFIEFTEEQDIYPEEEFLGMKAYEIYILVEGDEELNDAKDEQSESEVSGVFCGRNKVSVAKLEYDKRAIYYYDFDAAESNEYYDKDDNIHYIKYKNMDEDDEITLSISTLLPMM